MNNWSRLLACLFFTSTLSTFPTFAQTEADAQSSGPKALPPGTPVFTSAQKAVATVVSRDAHTRVEQWVERIVAEDGTTNDVVHSVTVIANGMHYRDGDTGEWRETNPEFVPVAGGWLASRGQHQCLVSTELFVAGAVTVISPEGATWKSTPMTLAVRDRASGQVLVLGESRATRGELLAPNTVLFRDAFAGGAVQADVQVVNSAAGVECDVILRSRLPSAAVLGVAAESSDLIVLTEIFETTAATQEAVDRGGRSDDRVRLGALMMDQGKAFGTDGGTEPARAVQVFKRVYQDQSTARVFLEEATPLDSLTPLLQELPEASLPNGLNSRWRNTAGTKGIPVRNVALSAAPSLPRRADGRFEVAAQGARDKGQVAGKSAGLPLGFLSPVPRHPSLSTRGVVLDWTILNSATNFTFRGDTTYRVTNAVTLSGTNVTFEGGTVVKYDAGVSASISVLSGVNIDWQGEPFRPITLTAKDDNSVGDTISGSTGNPSGAYAGQALILNGSGRTNALVLANLRVRHASYALDAVYFGQNGPLTLRHSQFVNCAYPFKLQLGYTGADTYFLQNVLVTGATTLFKDSYYARTQAAFLTVDGATTWFASSYSPHYCTNTVTDSILVATGSVNVGTTNNCWIASSGSGLFEAAGAGEHYLPAGGTVRAVVPSVEFDTGVPQSFNFTSYAPLALPATITNTVELRPRAIQADYALGYHYPKLDYVAIGTATNYASTLTGGILNLLATADAGDGLRIGFGGPKGIRVQTGSRIVSQGLPTTLAVQFGNAIRTNLLVRITAVQESPTSAAAKVTASSLFELNNGGEVVTRWTEVSLATAPPNVRPVLVLAGNNTGIARFRDTVFRNAKWDVAPNQYAYLNLWPTLAVTNCLFEGGSFSVANVFGAGTYDRAQTAFSLRNCLLRGGSLTLSCDSGQTANWGLYDNLFEGTTISAGTNAGPNSYNAFTAAAGFPNNGTGTLLSRLTNWVTGPLGPYYYPASGVSTGLNSLINVGSQANAGNVGLARYTTQTNLTFFMTAIGTSYYQESIEGTGNLDVGLHYPAAQELYVAATGAFMVAQLLDQDKDWQGNLDMDGLLDVLEDTNGNGVTDSGEADPTKFDTDGDTVGDSDELKNLTNPNDQDTDDDGAKDSVELTEGTNALQAGDHPPQRFDSWLFDTAGRNGELGCAPTINTALLADSYSGNGVSFTNNSQRLVYPVTWTHSGTNRTALNFWNGTVRFTYVPDWYQGGAGDKPNQWVRLLECGEWKLSIDPDGTQLIFQSPTTNGPIRTNVVINLPKTAGPAGRRGWDITLNYSPTQTKLEIGDQSFGLGLGVQADLPASVKSSGWSLGNSLGATNQAMGMIDDFETFNARFYTTFEVVSSFGHMHSRIARRAQVLSSAVQTNGLKFNWVRGWEGDWLTNSSLYSLSRRVVGATNWSTLATGLRTNTWTDLTATNGTYFEYRVDRHATVAANEHPTLTATRNGHPIDDRGRAILLVDQTLVTGTNTITAELDAFKRLLAADGWTVTNYFVPRHVDRPFNDWGCVNYATNGWPVNVTNQLAIKDHIRREYTNHLTTTNVVMIIGHVSIPYSGRFPEDGHSGCSQVDHDGAWVADSWYGDLTGTWTDTLTMSNCNQCINRNSPGDGRWDQDTLPLESDGSPGRLEVPVGRIDFAELPAFLLANGGMPTNIVNNAGVERELFKRYFDKVKRFRRGEIGYVEDFRAWIAGFKFVGMIDSGQRLNSHLWSSEISDPARLTQDMFLATTNYLWGIHGDYSYFDATGPYMNGGFGDRYHPTTEIATGEPPRGLFNLLHGSYCADWFHGGNDVLRTCLGAPDSSLTFSWLDSDAQWRSDAFHVGAPYCTALAATFAAYPGASSRATFILGDPTLREHYVLPVSGFSAAKSGTSANLVWTNLAAATAGYWLYTAPSTNTAKWNLLTNLAAGVTSWTHTPSNPSTNAYLIKAASLKTTGSGSYTNLSQGVAAPTEITIP